MSTTTLSAQPQFVHDVAKYGCVLGWSLVSNAASWRNEPDITEYCSSVEWRFIHMLGNFLDTLVLTILGTKTRCVAYLRQIASRYGDFMKESRA